jgi:hypothetical protein
MEVSIHEPKKLDFFSKRDEKERNLKEALHQLEEFKKRTPETMYPPEIYSLVTNPKIMYSSEYIRLLENAVLAKNSLEMMDLALERLLDERIRILEDLLK